MSKITDLKVVLDTALAQYNQALQLSTGTIINSVLIFNVIQALSNYSEAIISSIPLQDVANNVADLNDNSGGVSGSGTIAVVNNPNLSTWDGATVFPTEAQGTAINASITSIKNAIATLSVQFNLMRDALVNLGLMI